MNKTIFAITTLLVATISSADTKDFFTKQEQGIIQGCGIGIGLKYRTVTKRKIQKMCQECLSNASYDKAFIKKAEQKCINIVSNIIK